MPSLKVTFKLRERDLKHLREVLHKASVVADAEKEEEVIRGAEHMVGYVRSARPPAYILQRLEKLEVLIGILKDAGWTMPAPVRQKALGALLYLTDPNDLIPDQIPGLGFLDDAIMIELVHQQLRHEIDGYEAFRRFRHAEWDRPWYQQSPEKREKRIAARKKELRARIRERQRRDAERAGIVRGIRLF
ncbi:MAG: YkvA family protein [Myxococcota bacterium]